MTLHIITEGPTDAVLVQWLLQPETARYGNQIRVRATSGRGEAEVSAKSVMQARGEPAALTVTIPAIDPRYRQERSSFLAYYFKDAASPEYYRILFFAPSIEVILFKDESLPQDVFGRPLTDIERARAEYDPKRVLAELAAEQGLSMAEVWRRITAHSPAVVRAIPPVPDLIDFVHRILSPQPAAVPA